jgi:hypothetical protein
VKSNIHLSFDLWTSPNHKAIIVIVGHWTSHKFKVETALLGMREMTRVHKGNFIASMLHSIVKEYGIQDNLEYFQADNTSNNDMALRELEKAIRAEEGMRFNIKERCLHCLRYILNLTVKLLLFGGNVHVFPGREDKFDKGM